MDWNWDAMGVNPANMIFVDGSSPSIGMNCLLDPKVRFLILCNKTHLDLFLILFVMIAMGS